MSLPLTRLCKNAAAFLVFLWAVILLHRNLWATPGDGTLDIQNGFVLVKMLWNALGLAREVLDLRINLYTAKAITASLAMLTLGASLSVWGAGAIRRLAPGMNHRLLPGLGLIFGLGVLSSISALALFSHIVYRPVAFALWITSIAMAIFAIRKDGRPDVSWWTDLGRSQKLALAGIGALAWIGTLIPEITYDPLVYHLAYPSLYILNHGFVTTPHSLYAAFPQNTEMLYLFGLLFSGETAAKTIPLLLGTGIALVLLGMGRRSDGRNAGFLALLGWAGVPMVMFNMWTCMADIAASAFTLCAIITAACATDPDGRTGPGRILPRSVLLVGLFTGWAMGTKYTSFPLILFVLWVLATHRRQDADAGNGNTPMRDAVLATFIAMLTLAPWLIRNIAVYSNPLHPFGGAWLGNLDIDPGLWRRWMSHAAAHFPSAWFTDPMAFLAVFREPLGWMSPALTGMGDYTGVLPLFSLGALAIAAILLGAGTTKDPVTRTIQSYVCFGFGVWLITGGVARFVMPILAPLFHLWATRTDDALREKSARGFIWQVTTLLVLFCSYLAVLSTFAHMDGRQVLTGRISEESFLQSEHELYPTSALPAYRFIQNSMPADSAILVVGDARTYRLDRPAVAASIYDRQPIVVLSGQSADGDALYRRMRDENIGAILINASEAVRARRDGLTIAWTKDSFRVLTDFWAKHVELVWSRTVPEENTALFVYQVVETSATPAPLPMAIIHEWMERSAEKSPDAY